MKQMQAIQHILAVPKLVNFNTSNELDIVFTSNEEPFDTVETIDIASSTPIAQNTLTDNYYNYEVIISYTDNLK